MLFLYPDRCAFLVSRNLGRYRSILRLAPNRLLPVMKKVYLEPQTTIYKWLFQLDDSKSLHGKWLFNQTSIKNWLFRVPGRYPQLQISLLSVRTTWYLSEKLVYRRGEGCLIYETQPFV